MSVYTCACRGQRSEEGVIGSCEPVLWVLGTELGFSGRAGNTPNHKAISQAPFIQCFIKSTEKHLNFIHEAIPAGGYGNESSVGVLSIPAPVFHKILKARQVSIFR